MSIAEAPESMTARADVDRLRKANHRISNNLTVVLGMIQLQARKLERGPRTITREDALTILRDVASRIVSVGHLHRRLAERPHRETLDLADHLIESCTHLVQSLSLGAKVRLVERLEADCEVSPEQAQQLGLLICEIIMNAAKFAHPSGLPAEIFVGCYRGRDDRIAIVIGDDGVGLPEGFDVTKSRGGLRLIRCIASALEADLEIESDALGLSFHLLLPPRAE